MSHTFCSLALALEVHIDIAIFTFVFHLPVPSGIVVMKSQVVIGQPTNISICHFVGVESISPCQTAPSDECQDIYSRIKL